MARKVRDKSLDSREARSKLPARGKPYWRAIERGLHLGYRKLAGKAGTWCTRHYIGSQKYAIESLGSADDLSDADGVAILSYWQAQQSARDRMVKRAHTAAGRTGPLTVKAAVEQYLTWFEVNRRSITDTRRRAEAFIYPELGDVECEKLTAERLREWHVGLTKLPPRMRTRKGEKQQFRKVDNDQESQRKRRASANRTLTILKAALNSAWREGKIPSDTAWRRVQPFDSVDAARDRYLTIAEAKRLVNACPADFRKVVQAALQTGARYGQLAKLVASDFDADSGTLQLRSFKGRGREKIFRAILTAEGVRFFERAVAGLASSDLIFRKDNEQPWGASHQQRFMDDACDHAKIKPRIGIHQLRHTWASHAVMNGVHLMVVAKNLGHSDTRMVEKHYGHLAQSFEKKAIRKGAPRFGLPRSNLRSLDAAR